MGSHDASVEVEGLYVRWRFHCTVLGRGAPLCKPGASNMYYSCSGAQSPSQNLHNPQLRRGRTAQKFFSIYRKQLILELRTAESGTWL